MSRDQVVAACSRLTNTSYSRCCPLGKQKLISNKKPVPDAATADQRSFEALIVNVLANALRDRQLGAALGTHSVYPGTSHPTLRLHPDMARRVLWELLPRFDADYGGIRGVPGMRMTWQGRKIVLHDLLTDALPPGKGIPKIAKVRTMVLGVGTLGTAE